MALCWPSFAGYGILRVMELRVYVANRIREARRRLGLRQQDVADKVGVTRQTIIALEKGRLTNPSIQTCLLLGRLLGEPVDYLFYLVPYRDQKPGVKGPSIIEEEQAPFEILPMGLPETDHEEYQEGGDGHISGDQEAAWPGLDRGGGIIQ